jgi:hypothetical protein
MPDVGNGGTMGIDCSVSGRPGVADAGLWRCFTAQGIPRIGISRRRNWSLFSPRCPHEVIQLFCGWLPFPIVGLLHDGIEVAATASDVLPSSW